MFLDPTKLTIYPHSTLEKSWWKCTITFFYSASFSFSLAISSQSWYFLFQFTSLAF
jgi:hypothetical protein